MVNNDIDIYHRYAVGVLTNWNRPDIWTLLQERGRSLSSSDLWRTFCICINKNNHCEGFFLITCKISAFLHREGVDREITRVQADRSVLCAHTMYAHCEGNWQVFALRKHPAAWDSPKRGLPLQIKAAKRSASYTGCLLICFNTFPSCCDAPRHREHESKVSCLFQSDFI